VVPRPYAGLEVIHLSLCRSWGVRRRVGERVGEVTERSPMSEPPCRVLGGFGFGFRRVITSSGGFGTLGHTGFISGSSELVCRVWSISRVTILVSTISRNWLLLVWVVRFIILISTIIGYPLFITRTLGAMGISRTPPSRSRHQKLRVRGAVEGFLVELFTAGLQVAVYFLGLS
jgi:hypothetical protein